MSELKIKPHLPLGVAWLWVKFSFATFREKPINFLCFGLAFMLFSILPFVGSFLSVLVLARIYLSADKVIKQQPFGLGLNFIEILRQRNITNYAFFNLFFDLLAMSLFQELLLVMHLDVKSPGLLLDQRVLSLLVVLSLLRSIFFGISLAIISFNPKVRVLQALVLNWKLMLKHWAVISLGLFLLLPFLLIPLYVATIAALSLSSTAWFLAAGTFLLILLLLFMLVTTLFSYKLYQDGISCD